MLNLLSRSKLWIATTLFAANSLIAQQSSTKGRTQKSFEQGQELRQSQLMAGYNSPASIALCESWDLYLTATYLYWQAQQENIEIGVISQNRPDLTERSTGDSLFTTFYKNNASITSPNFTYRPGFRFGIGTRLSRDGWDALAEYTWFHGSIGSGVTPLPHNTILTIPPNGQYLYGIQGETRNFFYENADQSWGLKMDLLDLSLGRGYYSGTKFIMRPFFGARGAWIRQTLNTSYTGSTQYDAKTGHTQATINDSSASWGVGPRTGFESNWLLGYGVRLIGNGSVDVLYTRYKMQKNDQIVFLEPSVSPITENASVSQTIDYLRTHTDLEMGFGWGSYFDYNNWHIDLSATYGFQIFWDQNMFRSFTDDVMQAKSMAPNGNLYIHGLSINSRLDF